ncbi:MAG: hypothetical protein VKJ06_07950 [Vampirovibrionales bacterium]|nr:hypothetical protein [Vampirovibrionales bacterium]
MITGSFSTQSPRFSASQAKNRAAEEKKQQTLAYLNRIKLVLNNGEQFNGFKVNTAILKELFGDKFDLSQVRPYCNKYNLPIVSVKTSQQTGQHIRRYYQKITSDAPGEVSKISVYSPKNVTEPFIALTQKAGRCKNSLKAFEPIATLLQTYTPEELSVLTSNKIDLRILRTDVKNKLHLRVAKKDLEHLKQFRTQIGLSLSRSVELLMRYIVCDNDDLIG